jgi:hemerythrin
LLLRFFVRTKKSLHEGRRATLLIWTPSLSVNIVEIDEQHKELFAAINHFLEAIELGTDLQALKELLNYLEQYLVVNFDYEEKYMDTYSIYGYDDEIRHKSAHKAFKSDFAEFRVDMTDTNVSQQFRNEFKNWICNWWLIHISKMDKGLGEFIRKVILF